jgi:multicomponent K+:H+ antiporter subunit E
MIGRILPHPLLTILLIVVWQMLVNSITVGTLVLGVLFGILIPILTSAYWPDRPRFRHPLKIASYVIIVLWDICIANLVVARIILFRRNSDLRSNWVTIPLELSSPEAITVLAGTITMTPGTVTSDISSCGRVLLVHCLDAPDPEAVCMEIKHRYERRLKEIFE